MCDLRPALSSPRWTCRLAALRKLQGLVLGGAAELDSFVPQLRTLVKGLCSTASDLRSSLVKESCASFELLAKTLRQAFEAFAETFVPVLLEISNLRALRLAPRTPTLKHNP